MAVSSGGGGGGSRSGRMSDLHLAKINREISPQRCNANAKATPRVPVVYYLSRDGQLEHPHFTEVSMSSPHIGLLLRDVINRLNVLRGQGMASLYSWSCKRSYKNGFVWHDLSENDVVYPAHAQEYVLKGSLLPPQDKGLYTQQLRPQPELLPSTGALRPRRRNQSCSSVEFSPEEYSVYKMDNNSFSGRSAAAADASTQTDDYRRRRREENRKEKEVPSRSEEIEMISPPPSDSSPETLEKLMEAEGGRLILRPSDPAIGGDGGRTAGGGRSSVLMQLITCGTISFKDCSTGNGGLGFISNYRVRAPRAKLEQKEYFSGSIVDETRKQDIPAMKRSTSYNGGR